MYTTIQEVKDLTNYDVPLEVITMAQGIIEAYTGRVEAEIVNPVDLMLLGRATAYQAAYMFDEENDYEQTFKQVSAIQVQQYGSMVTFTQDGITPWVAPLAKLACGKLSWKRIRSVRTGSIFYRPPVVDTWRTQ